MPDGENRIGGRVVTGKGLDRGIVFQTWPSIFRGARRSATLAQRLRTQ